MKKLIEIRQGMLIPDGAVFIEKKIEHGRQIGERCVRRWGIFPFNGGDYVKVYEEIEVYVYEVPA